MNAEHFYSAQIKNVMPPVDGGMQTKLLTPKLLTRDNIICIDIKNLKAWKTRNN